MPWVPEGPSVIAQHKVLKKCVFFSCVLEGHLKDHAMRWDIIKLRISSVPLVRPDRIDGVRSIKSVAQPPSAVIPSPQTKRVGAILCGPGLLARARLAILPRGTPIGKVREFKGL